MTYPKVLSEDATLDLALHGRSLVRFGDGELKLALGASACAQGADPRLAGMLRRILKEAAQRHVCVVAIPNVRSATPKAPFWTRYAERRITDLYDPAHTYGSAFVTRPDSAPWIDRPDYWAKVVDIWRDRDVVLVRGSTKSLTAADLPEAASVEEIVGPRQHAFAEMDALIARLKPERRKVLLCLGPTATALGWELHARDVWALDLGHIGMFLRKYRRGEARIVTDEDRQAA